MTKAASNRTKLLLIGDVEDLGSSGEVVDVKPGYARNFLLPKGYAVNADKHTLRMQDRLQEERAKQSIGDKKDSEQLAKSLEGVTLSTVVKVDPEGHMFGSVSQLDITHLLAEEKGITITKKMVLLAHPIKETGVYTIELKLKEDVKAEFTLKVVPDRVVEAPISDVVKPIEPIEEPKEEPSEAEES
ncbi:MAG: 50S ribosomal protein L9 [Chlamydiae bacterium]|nr:50S ribosomal protein L9 [Chlamydiota bacterium]